MRLVGLTDRDLQLCALLDSRTNRDIVDDDLFGAFSAMPDVTYLTAEIVAAAASNEVSRMRPDELVSLIKSVRAALSEDGQEAADQTPEKATMMTKAQWSKLVTGPKIKSLIDGKLYSTLKRHLTRHGHDPKSYREAYGLPVDFPMVSPEYSASRSAMALKLGLGGGSAKKAVKVTRGPAKRGRKPKAA